MALNRHFKHILNLYIFSVFLIIIGAGVLIGGILGGIALRNKIGRLGRELAILQVQNIDDWGDIPGYRDRSLTHQFHIFNVTNPREVLYGQQPISKMFGPWTFTEERDTEDVVAQEATDVFNYTGELFTFNDHIFFFQSGVPEKMSTDLSETLYVYNYETFTMQFSHRAQEDWMRAIRSLSGMMNYTSVQFRDHLIMEYLQKNFYQDHYSSRAVFAQTRLVAFKDYPRIPQSTLNSMWSDEIFGFSNFRNAKFWGDVWEQRLRFGRSFVKDYFFLPRGGLQNFLDLFCSDWQASAQAVTAAFRMRGIISPEIMFYRQWSNMGASKNIFGEYKSITEIDPLVPGHPELQNFLDEVFFSNLGIRNQFEDVKFAGSSTLENRLLKLFTQDDLQVSLFNATNMKVLFELSSTVKIDNVTGQYEVFKLQPLQDVMGGKVTTKELFVVYSYLRNLIDSTFLRTGTQFNSTFDRAQMAFTLPDVIKNEFTRFRANFTSKIIAATALKFLALDDCSTSILRLFPGIRASTFWNNPTFDITTTEGAGFWWRLHIGRRTQDIALLEQTGYTLERFEEFFGEDESDFNLFTNSIMDGIGMGLLDQIWRKEGDLWCSIQEISFHQMMSGIITQYPPDILNDFSPADNFVEFFGLDDAKLISPEFNLLGNFQNFTLDPEVDVTYREVIQGMRDSRLFNPFYILSILNNQWSDIPRFCTENFKSWLTFLYRNRGLPPLVRPLTVKEIFNGTVDSEYLLNVQRMNPQNGGDPTVRTTFNILPHDGVPERRLKTSLFSGNVNEDRARNMMKFNDKEEFITVDRTFYHVDRNPARTGMQSERVNPWLEKVWFASGTDGFQFNPDMTNRDDLTFYSDYFKAIIKVDFQTVVNIFGLKGFIFETPISLYEKNQKGSINGITLNNEIPYHNFHFNDMFNASGVFGVSYFVTEPIFSRVSGKNIVKIQSEIINQNEESITGATYWNDNIICEPWSGLVIRGDTGFQMNFFYDSYTPSEYQQYLMPYVLYNRRMDIDGTMARDLFNEITMNDERMRLVFILSLIIGGILTSWGGSLFVLIIFRNRQRSKILKEVREEEKLRKKTKLLKKKNNSETQDTGVEMRINGSLHND